MYVLILKCLLTSNYNNQTWLIHLHVGINQSSWQTRNHCVRIHTTLSHRGYIRLHDIHLCLWLRKKLWSHDIHFCHWLRKKFWSHDIQFCHWPRMKLWSHDIHLCHWLRKKFWSHDPQIQKWKLKKGWRWKKITCWVSQNWYFWWMYIISRNQVKNV